MLDSANRGILRLGDQLVVVTTPAVDAGWAVARTLEWLCTNGHDELVQRATDLVNASGGESDYTLFYDAPADTPYKTGEANAAKEILILEGDGRTKTLADVSPFADGLMRQMSFQRLHVAESWRDRVAQVLVV